MPYLLEVHAKVCAKGHSSSLMNVVNFTQVIHVVKHERKYQQFFFLILVFFALPFHGLISFKYSLSKMT